MSSLAQLRNTLRSLQSYELPDRYLHSNGENDLQGELKEATTAAKPILNPENVKRYRKARDAYLRSRITELFLEHLSTYDGSDRTLQLPSLPSKEEEDELHIVGESVRADLRKSVTEVKESFEEVQSKYQVFSQRRDELQEILDEMENENDRNNLDNNNNESFDHPMDEDKENEDLEAVVDESEMALQEERLAALIKKRTELESKLRQIRMEGQEVEFRIENKKKMVKELMKINIENNDDSQKDSNSSDAKTDIDDMEEMLTLKEIEAETEDLKKQAQDFHDMSDYYESMRISLEELCGMKILSVSTASLPPSTTPIGGHSNKSSPKRKSPRHRRSPSSISILEDQRSSKNDSISLKVLLLDKHIVLVTLTSNMVSTNNCASPTPVETFRVSSAEFQSSTVLLDTLPNEDENSRNPTKTVSVTIPPLDDLVRLSSNLDPVQDLRFLLRETMARIRTLSARVEVLAKLRKNYLTKIGDAASRTNYGYGGEDQEIVCSLNAGITVVIRLTADCPLLEGSAYIHQIEGMGGWEEEVLSRMKTRVNEKKSRSPLEIMDSLVEEIGKVERSVPKTPILPRKGKTQQKSLF